MDILYEDGVRFIHYLQTRLFPNHPAAIDVFVTSPQYLADPDTLMIFVFPLLLVFNRWLACRFALTIGVIDMVNTLLKWMLQGERPYWWVQESHHRALLPTLEHHPLTCETGPGSPSGHAMSSAAVGFVLASAISDRYIRGLRKGAARQITEFALWTVYAMLVTTISVARLRLATHFPHQCLLGAAAGLCGGWIICHLPLDRITRKHFFTVSLLMFTAAVVTFWALVVLGIDPNRTVQLALKHCVDRSYVKMSTTPWHSVYRNSALMIAAGFCATTYSWRNEVTQVRLSAKEKIAIAALSVVMVQALASIPYPHQPTYVFYICAFVKNITIVGWCLILAPMTVLTAFGTSGSVDVKQNAEFDRKTSGTAIRQG